jgi:hypothetical protein
MVIEATLRCNVFNFPNLLANMPLRRSISYSVMALNASPGSSRFILDASTAVPTAAALSACFSMVERDLIVFFNFLQGPFLYKLRV